MKRIFAIVLCLALVTALFAGCSTEETSEPTQAPAESSEAVAATDTSSGESAEADASGLKIGFCNLDDSVAYCQYVKESIQRVCDDMGIELVTADNALDGPTAVTNAEAMVLQGVDGVIEYQTDTEYAEAIMEIFDDAGIPVIAVDIPHPGAPFYGADNYNAGYMSGEGVAEWVNDNWDGVADAVISLELPQSGEVVMQRSQGMVDGFMENVANAPSEENVYREDAHHTQEEGKRVMDDLLSLIPEGSKIAVFTVQDITALGAIASLESAGRQDDAVIGSQNCGPEAVTEMYRDGTCLWGSTGYFPQTYGDDIVPLLVAMINGEDIPEENFVSHIFVNRDNLPEFYDEDYNYLKLD
jgi:ribose transport system substrate-binding protein